MVAFQPPDKTRLEYPCIVYSRDSTYKAHADNNPFIVRARYLVTVMDRDPDSPIFDAVESFPECTLNRVFESDQLNHRVFQIYF